jgi:hypothetical protein
LKIKKNETCEWGTKEAIKDYKSGKLMLIRYGLEVESATPYWTYLTEEYNIYVKSSEGCVSNPSFECYNNYMISKIEERYGKDFFEKLDKSFRKSDK